MQRVERLTNYYDIEAKNISFSKHEVRKVPGKDITYERIPITIIHDDNLYGSLFIKTEKCFSFGAQQNINKETGVLNGWMLPIAMYNRDGATEEQRKWVEKFGEIVERCKDYVMQLYDFERPQLDKIGGCMWWPKNEGIVDESRGPTLYSKIIAGRSGKRFDTKFREVKDLQDNDETGVVITKEELIENCNVIAVIKIDSIYICGENVSLQVKVYEALVEEQEELPSFLRPVAIKAHTQHLISFKD